MVRPWKEVYDEIIVNHMNSVAVVLAYPKNYEKNKRKETLLIGGYRGSDIVHIDGKPVIKLVQEAQSVTDIWHAIQNAGYPKVHRETVYDHLDKLVGKEILNKLPKVRRQYNKALYELSKLSLVRSLDTLPPTLNGFISDLGTLRRIIHVLDLK